MPYSNNSGGPWGNGGKNNDDKKSPWGSGDDKYILLNSSGAQGDYEVGAPVSNGFTLVGNNDYNNSSGEYIYYAHA